MKDGRRRHGSELMVLAAVVGLSLVWGCSAYRNAGSGELTSSYFIPPQNVWTGIERTLVELDYLITDQNRIDGRLRAESTPEDGGAMIVLHVDQIMRTNDQVHVYVKPADGGGDRPATPAELEAAGKTFLAALDKDLNG